MLINRYYGKVRIASFLGIEKAGCGLLSTGVKGAL